MKWPSLDESVSLCICLLTVACNREMEPFFLVVVVVFSLWGGISGSGSKCNCATRVGSDDLRYRPDSGFSLKHVQTSITSRGMPIVFKVIIFVLFAHKHCCS